MASSSARRAGSARGAEAATAAPRVWDLRGPERLYVAIVAVNYAVMSLIWFLLPAWRGYLYKERYPVERLTAFFFFAAALVTVVSVRRAGLRWRHPYMLIAPLAFLCFGEELSWGVHELRWEPPRVLWLKIDALHDLLTLAFAVYLEHGSWRSRMLVALGAAAVAAVVAITRHRFLYPLARVVSASPVWRLVAVGVGLIALSLILDTDQLPWRYFKAVEEMTELNAALALLIAALQITPASRHP